MLKVITVNWENVTVTLGRPTVADARLRYKIWKALDEPIVAADTFSNFITQVVSTQGLPDSPAFKKMTVFPGADEVKALFEEYSVTLDEAAGDAIRDGLLKLRETGESDPKNG